jgi:hypothetical protein
VAGRAWLRWGLIRRPSLFGLLGLSSLLSAPSLFSLLGRLGFSSLCRLFSLFGFSLLLQATQVIVLADDEIAESANDQQQFECFEGAGIHDLSSAKSAVIEA